MGKEPVNLPLVSVLMTAYNREKYIGAAIESVLDSSYTNFELIIVDDGSTDSTLRIARSFENDSRVKIFINDSNLGDYHNRNKAAFHANGKYIKYLDADDLIYRHGLEVMTEAMEKFPEAGFGLASKGSDDFPFPMCIVPKQIYQEHFNGLNHFDRAPGSSIIRLDAFKKVGGFSGARMIGDYEFWFKIARYYPMVRFSFDLYWNRLHDGQESKSEYAKHYGAMRKKVLEDAMQHPDCPLDKNERDHFLNMARKSEARNRFMSILSKVRRSLVK